MICFRFDCTSIILNTFFAIQFSISIKQLNTESFDAATNTIFD